MRVVQLAAVTMLKQNCWILSLGIIQFTLLIFSPVKINTILFKNVSDTSDDLLREIYDAREKNRRTWPSLPLDYEKHDCALFKLSGSIQLAVSKYPAFTIHKRTNVAF